GVTYAVLGAAVITADAILYLEPARNEKQNGSIEEGTEVVVVATTGVFSQLSDGSWIESKYVYEFSTPYPATADKLGQGTTVAKISYYEYPSENSTKLGEISAGVVRNLYAQSGNWYQAYVGGQYVWMRADGFNFTKANSSVKITMGIITADTDMYVGPGREFVTCGTILEGREVNVYEIRDGWYKIYSGGKYVWVDGNYLYDKATGDPAIADKIGQGTTTKKVTIYSLPSEESKALGTIGADKIRNLYAQSGNWYQIYATINGVSQFCWVRCDGFNYTKANTNASYATVVIAETTDTYYGHGTEYETAVRLNAGTKVNVYEQWEDWYLVYRSGKYLWIQADKVKDFMLK
ncbi:MAG: hypothetical protein HUJ93_09385, partial [Bacteroidales bacterium]|nr:hypothetical protein [Bacteroidales bacterium]